MVEKLRLTAFCSFQFLKSPLPTVAIQIYSTYVVIKNIFGASSWMGHGPKFTWIKVDA